MNVSIRRCITLDDPSPHRSHPAVASANRHGKVLDAHHIGLTKRDAFLVYTFRGSAVDEEARMHALTSVHIGGGGSDVFPYKPLPERHPFNRLPNVVLTPHLGSVPDRGLAFAPQVAAPNIRAAIFGKLIEGQIV